MRSVLLVKTSSLGDVVHNLPVVSDLRHRWPELRVDWVVEEAFAEIPHLHPGVNQVFPVAIRRWRKHLGERRTWQEMRAFVRSLRAHCYDLVIDTQGLVKSALITRLADGLHCGYSREAAREPLAALAYDSRYAIPKSAHAVERNRWLAAAACDTVPDLPLHYGLAHLPAGVAPGDYVVLLTATSRDDKLWPEAHWVELGCALAALGLRTLLPAGNPRERERAARIAAAIPGAEAVPPASLTTLAHLLAASQAVVGVDTGLTHLAAALDRPVCALYVATDPGLTGVYAGPRALNLGGKGQCPSPAEVLAHLQSLLGEFPAAGAPQP